MDIFAHGLWTYAIFNKKKYVWMATLFGVLPDLLSFGILFVFGLFTGTLPHGKPALSSLPNWLFSAYNMTHSLIVFAVVFAFVFLITKKWFWPMLGWPIHILIDIPTHSTMFFPTPFLWPLADYRFNGISWGTPWFMLLNYSSILVVYLWIAHSRAKSKKKSKKQHK